MTVGLGSGSTVAHLLEILGRRGIDIRCVSSSLHTEQRARHLGLRTQNFTRLDRLEIAIDGADLIAPDFWLVKGGGAAHTREKVVAAAADRFVVIADSSKPVDRLRSPVPLELLGFGIAATLSRLGPVTLRDVPESPDGGLIADWTGELTDPALFAATLSAEPGVIEHGLFPGSMVSDLVIGRESGADWLERR
ncbi:MAG: ribose 5-phosphate isomerase A [Acidimicrobiia bacterium]